MDIEKIVKTTTQELEKLVSTETIVGKPQTFEGKVIIPISKICFGFGAGGGSGAGGGKEKDSQGSGEGGGSGAGGSVEPIAFIVIEKEKVNVYPLKSKGSISSAIDAMAEKCPQMIMDMKKSMEQKSGIDTTKMSRKKK